MSIRYRHCHDCYRLDHDCGIQFERIPCFRHPGPLMDLSYTKNNEMRCPMHAEGHTSGRGKEA